MNTDDFNLKDLSQYNLRTQLEVMKEKYRNEHAKFLQIEQELEKLQIEVKETKEELNNLKTDLAVSKEQLKEERKKNKDSKFYKLLVNLLFLLVTILCGFGINMLTSNPPNSIGYFLIAFAVFAYIIASGMTYFRIGGSTK